MLLRKTNLFLFTAVCVIATLQAQIDPGFVRDSIEIEHGVDGTTDFEPALRLVNETFDANNRPLRGVLYRYVSPDELEPHQRQTYAYDDDGHTTFFGLEAWDASEETWRPEKAETSVYENGRLIEKIRRIAVQGVLVNRRRWTYQYNAAGRETEKLLAAWSTDTESWTDLSRKTTTYTTDNRIATQLLERFDGTDWTPRRRRAWTYDAGMPQPTQTLGQIWSTATEEWVNDSRKTYGMAANGLWSGSVVQEWNAAAGEWVNDVRETFTIDLTNGESSFGIERWQEAWVPDFLSRYNYSTSENTALLQNWNDTEQDYDNFLRYRSLFNAQRLPERQTGMQNWDAEAGAWVNRDYTRRVTYFWRANDPSSSSEVSADPLACRIPNPYRSGATIECAANGLDFPLQLDVLNAYGQRVRSARVDGPVFSVPTAGLPYGLYVFRLSDERRVYEVRKVIVTR